MLQVKSTLVDIDKLEANLHIVQSTSPSYLLMTSLDMARQDLAMNGTEMINHAVSLAEYARTEINKIDGMVCLGKEVIGANGIKDIDLTRLIISAKQLGMTGFELASLLDEQYNVDVELSDYINVLAIVTYANTMEDMNRLIEALQCIAADRANGQAISNEIFLPKQPDYVISPRQAYFSKRSVVSLGRG